MPHLTLEYSAGLSDEDGMALLCRKLARSLHEQKEGDRPVYPLGGIRVRALRCEAYCIADGLTDAAFLHANLKIGAGRSEAVKRATGDALFDIIKQHFAETFEKQGLALSLEINEFSEAGTWKHNNLHAHLKR
ncbi:5-carboxymethyl-2-hydroxymuconate Delta-isomerase [Burkholderia cenocepacia]|uniref:5-carboxymethyl-2-hydroxymuconate Delta-isomerase n=1 Tax=Burkholderia cenocepacia TaxID=95486 RepID=UPI00285D5478|nr:5-carboxymethyl-2-hydroxymuconate Delta-isomerase [Burkholderia cenocepacia]MDR8105014.1 5-carboxymethyl-2-hydroxymuconate Delta-isomerase [Burkholderia cenocepacia]